MGDREKVTKKILSWSGAVMGDATHKHIIDLYNKFSASKYNHGRKVRLSYTQDWCAATVTAAFWEAGLIELWPCGECSCGEIIKWAKQYGIWQENDAYRPQIGDAIIYAWSDSGKGDNTTGHDHIGLVVATDKNYFVVCEGNKGTARNCGTRQMQYNGRYIRGFVTPKFQTDPAYYLVKKGDSLSKIAAMFSRTINDLLMLNPQITNPNLIYAGQRIRVK